MIKSFSKYLKLSKGFVGMTLYSKDRSSYYTEIEIPKRNGDTRIIHAVNGRLKTLQKKTYERLSSIYHCSPKLTITTLTRKE